MERSSARRDPVKSDFLVPYRCLVPQDSTGALIGKNGVLLKALVSETGAEVHFLRSEENPRGLEDRIMTLQGPFRVKEAALHWVLARLREQSRRSDSEKTVFVCLVPEVAASLIIGVRGATIRDLSSKSGAEIDICKEPISGTRDLAVTLRGRCRDIEAAMYSIHFLLQDCVSNGKLVPGDFSFCKPGKRETEMPKIQVEISPSYDSGIPVRLAVTQEEADWLVSDKALHAVRDIEGQFSCLVSLEQPFSPPQSVKDEIAQISASTYQNKADAAEALLRLLHSFHKDRDCGLLMEAEASRFVIGLKGSSINHISALSGSVIVLARKGEFEKETFNLMSCAGSLESRIAAVRMIVARIDLANGKASQHIPKDPSTKRLAIQLSDRDAREVDTHLAVLVKNNPAAALSLNGNTLVVSGRPNAITSVVAQLFNLDIAQED